MSKKLLQNNERNIIQLWNNLLCLKQAYSKFPSRQMISTNILEGVSEWQTNYITLLWSSSSLLSSASLTAAPRCSSPSCIPPQQQSCLSVVHLIRYLCHPFSPFFFCFVQHARGRDSVSIMFRVDVFSFIFKQNNFISIKAYTTCYFVFQKASFTKPPMLVSRNKIEHL